MAASKTLTSRKSDRIDLSMTDGDREKLEAIMAVSESTASELWRSWIRREYLRLRRAGAVK